MRPHRRLQPLDWSDEQVRRHLMHAQRVVEVFPISPAEAIGIRVGWRVLLAGDAAPTSLVIDKLRMEGADGYVFYDPETNRTWYLEGGAWPFGLLMTGVDTEGFRARVLIDSTVDDDLFEAFGRGEVDTFAALVPVMRESLEPTSLALFGPLMSEARKDKAIAKSDDFYMLAFLAFGYLCLEQIARARYFRDACTDAMDRSKNTGYSLRFTALLDHIAGRIAWAEGDRETAIAFAERAVSDAPQYELLRDTLAVWTDSPPLYYCPRWVGEDVPVDYELPQQDPLGFWPDGPAVSLKKTLAAMDDDQIMVLIFLPNYRANYYYNIDIATLTALHLHDKERIAAVHVLANRDSTQQETGRSYVEGLARDNNLPVSFLRDRDNLTSEPLDLYRSPTTLLVNSKGTVLANGVLFDESAYWYALERNADVV